ncbi:MAG: hypothetical protein Q4D21_06520 [Phascolarctobacterium sp.]|nr:hypothetical protein [Phascolarctobacterium sp.]
MINMKKAFLTAAVLSALCACAFASDNMSDAKQAPAANDRPAISDQRGHHRNGKFEKMTPEQREQLHKENQAKREAWKKMTPEERKAHMEKFRKEQQEKREKMMNEKMKDLTPEQRVEVRKFIKDQKDFQKVVQDHRKEMKERMEKMTPEQREVVKLSRPPKHKGMHKGPGEGRHFGGPEHGPQGGPDMHHGPQGGPPPAPPTK